MSASVGNHQGAGAGPKPCELVSNFERANCSLLPMPFVDDGGESSKTQWSLISRARGNSEEAFEALEHLAARYRGPICDYLRALGRTSDAEDLTQEFFHRKFLRESFLNSVHRGSGSFRKFLKLCVRRFLIDQIRKRPLPGCDVKDIDLDAVDESGAPLLEISSSLPTADRQLDRAWVRELILRARLRLEVEFKRAGKDELGSCFLRELDEEPDLPTHQEIGSRLGMSPAAVTTSFYRFRERLKFLIRAEIEETVDGSVEMEEELRCLKGAFVEGDQGPALM